MHSIRRPFAAIVSSGVVALSLFVSVQRSEAATLTVDSTADDDGAGTTLREAILAANANPGLDTVVLPAGTFNLDGLKGHLGVVDDLIITGAGAAQTIISGDLVNPSRIFFLDTGTNLTIEGVTIEKGSTQFNNAGGVMQAIALGSLTIRDSVIRNNSSQFGGAIYASQNLNLGLGTITIENTTFSGNSTRLGPGGAIRLFNNPVTITDSTFIDNQSRTAGEEEASNGGALHVTGGTLTITGSTFSGNSAGSGPDSDAGSGGAIFVNGAEATIVNSTISGNLAYAHGGAIAASDGALVNLIHSTVAQNTSVLKGAGLYALSSEVPTKQGDATGGNIDLTDSLIHNNQSAAASNCEVVGSGTITSAGGNLSDDATCTGLTDPTDLNDNSGTTLGALADNGGPTRTHALMAGSTAIDAVPCIQGITDDQRDVSRPQGSGCDIGAYELVPSVGPTTTSTAIAVTTSTLIAVTTTPGAYTLPATGSRSPGSQPLIAAMLVACGVAMMLAVRRRPFSES